MECAVAEGARWLELAERPVRVQVIDRAHEIADPAVGRSRVHGERAADRGGDSDQALDPAEIQRGGLADQRRERYAGARQGFFAVKLRATETALELEDDAANAAVADEQVVAATDDGDRQLLAIGEHQRVADVLDVLRDDENVRGAADTQRGVEAQRFFEPHFAPDLS